MIDIQNERLIEQYVFSLEFKRISLLEQQVEKLSAKLNERKVFINNVLNSKS